MSTAAIQDDQRAIAAAQSFLEHYVDHDGRVVRRDQDGDTVSEGQGYAMLLAAAIGDESVFKLVWSWTEHNLQQHTGLFAFHWSAGAIVDSMPAADADLMIAWALDHAGERFHDAAWTNAAMKVAIAIARHEIGYDNGGQPMLAAGPWATSAHGATTVEPGYWSTPAETALAQLTGDKRLAALSQADTIHLNQLSDDGKTLPPDWAVIGGGQPTNAIRAPGNGQPIQISQDGLRTLVWASCTASGRALLNRWWQQISPSASKAPLSLSLDGRPTSSDVSPLAAVAAAAAARAAGEKATGDQLLERADAINSRYPTYYGAAWVALGRVLLTTTRLAPC